MPTIQRCAVVMSRRRLSAPWDPQGWYSLCFCFQVSGSNTREKMLEPPRSRYLILGGSLSLFPPRQIAAAARFERGTTLNKGLLHRLHCVITKHWPSCPSYSTVDKFCTSNQSELLPQSRFALSRRLMARGRKFYCECCKPYAVLVYCYTALSHCHVQNLCSAHSCFRDAHSLARSENRTWTERACQQHDAITPQIGDPKEAFPAFLLCLNTDLNPRLLTCMTPSPTYGRLPLSCCHFHALRP